MDSRGGVSCTFSLLRMLDWVGSNPDCLQNGDSLFRHGSIWRNMENKYRTTQKDTRRLNTKQAIY